MSRPACLGDVRVRCRFEDGVGCPCQEPGSTLGEVVDVLRDLADYGRVRDVVEKAGREAEVTA